MHKGNFLIDRSSNYQISKYIARPEVEFPNFPLALYKHVQQCRNLWILFHSFLLSSLKPVASTMQQRASNNQRRITGFFIRSDQLQLDEDEEAE